MLNQATKNVWFNHAYLHILCRSDYYFIVAARTHASASITQDALSAIFNNMDGRPGRRPRNSSKKRRCGGLYYEAGRRLPRKKLVVSGKNPSPALMGASGEAVTLTGWLMGRACQAPVCWASHVGLVVKRGIDSFFALSSVPRKRCSGRTSAQCAGGGEARLSGMSGGVRRLLRSGD